VELRPQDPSFVLALGSASPRRRDLVGMLGLPFVVQSADADETRAPGEPALVYVERVALAKLDAVRRRDLGTAKGVLVADTIVIAPDGDVLGKPRDDDEARAMLGRLSGATHAVATRFVLAPPAPRDAPLHAQTVTTRVTFRAMAPAEIAAYVAGGEGRDKAGAYAVQGRGGVFVERIEGSFTGVVGLPLCELVVAMRAVGWIA
jgi:septum formation protein